MKPYQGYSNRSEQLEKVKTADFKQIKLNIYKKLGTSYVVNDCTIPLKSPVTLSEIIVPVRNNGCLNAECIFDIEQILGFLKEQTYKDKDKLVYFCPNCIHINASNKREVDQLYFDRQTATLIEFAKLKYKNEVKCDPDLDRFCNGSLVFKKTTQDLPHCTYTVTHKQRKPKGEKGFNEVPYKIHLQIGQRAKPTQSIKFTPTDKTTNINGMKFSFDKILSQQSKILYYTKSFIQYASYTKPEDFQKKVVDKLESLLEANVKFQTVKQAFFTQQFTFSFSNKSYMEPQNSSFSTLNIFFPRLRLWRSYRVQNQNGKMYSHPQGAVYIKIGYKIYVVGGYKVKLPLDDKPKDPKEKLKYDMLKRKKLFQNTNQFMEIDIEPIIKGVLQPTRTVQVAASVIKLKKTNSQKPVIDQYSKEFIIAKPLANLPTNLSNSAGIYFNNSIYIFSGVILEGGNGQPFKEKGSQKCYCYNFGNKTWKSIRDLPSKKSYHSAIQYNNKIYIIGGTVYKENNYGRTNDQSSKQVQIYDPANDSYAKQEFKLNPMNSVDSCNDGFRTRALAIRYPQNQPNFIFITGDKHNCYAFNPSLLTFSSSGPQADLQVLVKQQKTLQIQSGLVGPKLQQIFDYSPPFIDGLFYYVGYNIPEKKNYVIYGTKGDWKLSEQFDHGSLFPK